MKIRVLALDGVFDTGLAAVLDTFTTANELASLQPGGPHFDIGVVGLTRDVRTALGMRLSVQSVEAAGEIDWLIVPALSTKMPEQLVPALGRKDVIAATAQLRRWHAAGTRVAAACIGTFVLAESGLLNGKEATTTWWLGPLFRPALSGGSSGRLADGRGIGRLHHGGCGYGSSRPRAVDGATGQPRTRGDRRALPDRRPATFAGALHDSGSSGARRSVDRALRALVTPASRRRLLSGAGRGRARRQPANAAAPASRRCCGKSPLSYFQDLRVELAVHLLQTTTLDIENIAGKVGYVDGATLRTLLRRRLGRGVRQLRAEGRRIDPAPDQPSQSGLVELKPESAG